MKITIPFVAFFAMLMMSGCTSNQTDSPTPPSLEAQIKNIQSNSTLPPAAKEKIIADLKAKNASSTKN